MVQTSENPLKAKFREHGAAPILLVGNTPGTRPGPHELPRTPLRRSPTSQNSPSETVWKFSGTRQPPHHQADHCRVDERFCASTKPLVILAHPPVLREPGEGPFHHPPAG